MHPNYTSMTEAAADLILADKRAVEADAGAEIEWRRRNHCMAVRHEATASRWRALAHRIRTVVLPALVTP